MIHLKALYRTGFALGVLTASVMAVQPINASDHQEAPTATAFLSADIGDYYVWHEEDQLNLILTFGTFAAPGLPASFDRDVLYGFHFDTSLPADGVADIEIFAALHRTIQVPGGCRLLALVIHHLKDLLRLFLPIVS